MTEVSPRPAPAGTDRANPPPDTPLRRGPVPVLVALVAGAGLFLAWQTAGTLLLIFAGLLFTAFLDAATRGLSYVLPVGPTSSRSGAAGGSRWSARSSRRGRLGS